MIKQDETGNVAVGFLADNRVLYCSPACASRDGQTEGVAVAQQEYDGLLEGQGSWGGLRCPVCGSDYPVSRASSGARETGPLA